MTFLKIIALTALGLFQLFSLTQLWSAAATGAIYVRRMGMVTVDANHAAWTQHLALYLVAALSLGYMLMRLWQKRKRKSVG